ncbi:hypothetical protein [Microbacterium sp. Root180]|uniref:hypothetical protein n=1 Tax=Microbacterium sp. Root180 TaxID=1736483 RepID=UPI0006F656D5|nr:hypothetical protein [Microbacterium sp. Root180]KRB36158.1 hypothetical protein ASD93_08585 [Microbacterium sp. Root180]
MTIAGCSGGPTPSDAGAAEAPEPSPSTTPIERPDVPAPPEELTFEAGADLDPEVWLGGWHAEPLDMSHGFAVVNPRDDWEEQHFAEDCIASRYHRFTLDGLDPTLDDRSLSNQLLAQVTEIPVDDITEEGSDVLFPVVGRYPMMADFRVRAGGWSDGRSWLAAARVFGALETALVIKLDCEAGSMTGASGQQLYELLPAVAGAEALHVGLGRVDWNVLEALDFDDGANLVESSGGRWVDAALMDDASWTYDEGEPDDGMWTFASTDGDCTAEYQQSRLDEEDADLSDLEASNQMLMDTIEDPGAYEAEDVVDGGFALGVPGNDLIAMRLLAGTRDTGRWVTVARALTGPLYGFALAVTCTEGDPMDALDLLAAKSAIQVVP